MPCLPLPISVSLSDPSREAPRTKRAPKEGREKRQKEKGPKPTKKPKGDKGPKPSKKPKGEKKKGEKGGKKKNKKQKGLTTTLPPTTLPPTTPEPTTSEPIVYDDEEDLFPDSYWDQGWGLFHFQTDSKCAHFTQIKTNEM